MEARQSWLAVSSPRRRTRAAAPTPGSAAAGLAGVAGGWLAEQLGQRRGEHVADLGRVGVGEGLPAGGLGDLLQLAGVGVRTDADADDAQRPLRVLQLAELAE